MRTIFTEAARQGLREAAGAGHSTKLKKLVKSRLGVVVESADPVGREWDSVQGRRKVIAVQSMGGREVALVQTGDRRIGHEIIALDSLEKEIDFETRQYQSKQKGQAQAKAHQAAQVQAQHAASSLDGFEDTLTPKMRGVAVRALTTKGITSNGRFYKSVRDLIRARVSEGWKVKGSGASRRFTGPEGQYLIQKDILKIGMDYAAYLSTRR